MNPESSAAVNQLRKVLQLEPSDSEAMVLLALKLQNVKKEDSLKLVTEALRLSPDVPQVTRYAAKYFRAAGSVDKSLEILKEAVKLAPHSSFLHHQIGLCYKQQLIDLFQVKKGSRRVPAGDKRALAAQCIYHFKKAVEMKPSNVHAQVNLAEAYGENRQLEDAEKIFSDLLGDGTLCDSDRQHCHANYGLFLMYKKKSELSAIRQFKIAYTMPVQTPARNLAGRKLKQIAERQLKSKDRVSEGFEMLAFVCTEDKQERKAMEYTMRAKQCDTPSVDSLSSAFTKTMKLE
ncbi:IFIT5 protein, partial [Amia calva]|nr:IFIT5 protein [Amia calva]